MSKSTKDERIIKWFREGVSVGRIARKLGVPQDTDRVIKALERAGLKPKHSEGRDE